MQFTAVLNIFIVKTELNSTFTNDLKRKEKNSKNVHSYRVCSFKWKVHFLLFRLILVFSNRLLNGSFWTPIYEHTLTILFFNS